MPRDRYMENKTRTTLMRFGLVGGIESDTDPGRVQTMDSNNVFPSPNGSEAGPRPGCEIRKRYRVTTDPVGRKAILIETAPPDVGLGNLIMVQNTIGGRNAIVAGAFVRDRTQLPLQSAVNAVSLQLESINVEYATTDNEVSFFRTGDITIPDTVFYTTANGTALAGAQYVAQSGTWTFESGVPSGQEFTATISVAGSGPGDVGKFFFFQIFAETPSTIISPIATTVINIVEP